MRDFPLTALWRASQVSMAAFSAWPLLNMTTCPQHDFYNRPIHDILGDKYTRFPAGKSIRRLLLSLWRHIYGAGRVRPANWGPVKFIAETVLPRACRNLETPRQAMATWVRLEWRSQEAVNFMPSSERCLRNWICKSPMVGLCTAGHYRWLFKGVHNIVLDIRRYPDKVKKATEAITEHVINYALAYTKREPNMPCFLCT